MNKARSKRAEKVPENNSPLNDLGFRIKYSQFLWKIAVNCLQQEVFLLLPNSLKFVLMPSNFFESYRISLLIYGTINVS